jgi:ankyrin repeat protein
MNINYYQKYLKYKSKYFSLQEQIKGGHCSRSLPHIKRRECDRERADTYSKLHLAIKKNSIEEVKGLLNKENVNELTNIKYSYSDRPIHLAIRKNFKDIVILLLSKGADLTLLDSYGNLPLQIAAINNNNTDIAELLLNNEIISNNTALHTAVNRQNMSGNTALHTAVNRQNKSGNTALHTAVTNQNIKFVKFLIERGADVNIKNLKGETPLAIATNEAIKKLLLEKKGGHL